MSKAKKTWLITGCSTGLGRAFAEEVLASGDNVVVTARKATDLKAFREDYPETAQIEALDVTNPQQVTAVVTRAKERFGAIDVLLNNAGYGLRGAVEEAASEEIRAVFETNFFGTVRMIQAVLPSMREAGSGTIVNVSSIAGRFAMPGSAFYAASKFAIEGMSDALRKEVAPFGIRVVVLKPGAFRTDFAGRSLTGASLELSAYDHTVGKRRKKNDVSHGTQPGDPQKAARALIDVVGRAEVPFRLLLGKDAIKLTRAELRDQSRELEAWLEVSSSTEYGPEGQDRESPT